MEPTTMIHRQESPTLADASLSALLQQEVSQRLLAIRMNAALYSRQNEGRKTQALSDQTVEMIDEVIRLFDSLLELMRLPLQQAQMRPSEAVSRLMEMVGEISGIPYAAEGHSCLDELPRERGMRVFDVLYHCLLQLLLEPAKVRAVTVRVQGDALSIEAEHGEKALASLHRRIQALPDVVARAEAARPECLLIELRDGGKEE